MMRVSKIILFYLIIIWNNAFAVSHFVKPDGNDSANGLTHQTAWKSVSKVNSYPFSVGDDVYFLSDAKWVQRLVVDWDGKDNNRATIGAYYLNQSGAVVIGINPNGQRPILSGTYPLFEQPGAIPAKRYAGMIHVYGDYVTVQNIRVENSAGIGINVNKTHHHTIIENNEVDTSAGSSILFQRTSYSNIMRNNKMHKCAVGWYDKKWSGTWPICNGAVGSRNNLIEGNLVTGSYGEGIVAFDKGADNNIIRANTVVILRAVGIYVDNGSNNIIENNRVVGDSYNNKPNGSAFAVSVEDYVYMANATGNIFRNNLAANTQICIWLGVEPDALSKGYKVGGYFIGNTCVGTEKPLSYGHTGSSVEEFSVSNNIFTGLINNLCRFPSATNIKFNNNLWNVKPGDADCRGSNDIIANPLLGKTIGWENTGITNIPTSDDFKPQPTSPVYSKGKANPNLTLDYYGNVRPSVPAIGAIDSTGGTVEKTSVNKPENVLIRFH